MNIKNLFWNYNKERRKLKRLMEKIETLETKAEKITPTYSKNESSGSVFNSSSKVESNCVDIVDYQRQAEIIAKQLNYADTLLKMLKSYQRYLVKRAYIYHNSIKSIAISEHTSTKNIQRILDNAIKSLE